MRKTLLFAAAIATLAAQPVFTDVFPPEEFAARRAKVIDKIGDAVAVVLGATEPPGETPFRQNSQFHYLSGVVEPRAVLILDGRTKKTTLFLNPHNQQQQTSMYGPAMSPGEEAVRRTGIDFVLPRVPAVAGRGRGARETSETPLKVSAGQFYLPIPLTVWARALPAECILALRANPVAVGAAESTSVSRSAPITSLKSSTATWRCFRSKARSIRRAASCSTVPCPTTPCSRDSACVAVSATIAIRWSATIRSPTAG